MTPGAVVGVFDSDQALLSAARAAKKAGLPIHDAYSPFPIHGMDQALELGHSFLSKVCFGFGAAGLVLILSFQYWVSLFDWPMNIGGKSLDASPALIPVAFEMTVLLAGLGTVAVFLKTRRLSPVRKPEFEGLGANDDRFLLALSAGKDADGGERARRFLKEQGALLVREAGPRA